jgi:PAS domain S-box-containing protein
VMDTRNGGGAKSESTLWRSLDERTLKFLDALNVGFIHMDMDFGILEVNEVSQKWFGYTRDAVIGRHTSEFLGPADFARLKNIDLKLLRQKKQYYQFEFDFPDSKGKKSPYLASISLEVDQCGTPLSTYVLLTDIREQRKMQHKLALANQALAKSREALVNEKNTLEAILFGIGDCVTVFDPQGNLLLSNPKGKEIRGNRRNPLLPLEPGARETFSFELAGERRQFTGQIEVIHDNQGTICAYAEILKETTDRIRLQERENELLQIRERIRRGEIAARMICASATMQKVYDLLLRYAAVDSSILILGETGVGKELAAREIHARSKRAGRPFVAVNCGAIPETLLESELFGHVKGAFTGAISSHLGLIREAQGGTLFLDEVGDLNPSLQVKLLRALQDREIRPVGGNRSYPIDVRVITATHQDLKQLVQHGHFREDLYYRIAVIPVLIPPLRERRDDILPLAEHFVRKHSKEDETAPKKLSHAAQRLLLSCPWPGNVRELENSIEHALAMSRGTLLKSTDFPVTLLDSQRARVKHPPPPELLPVTVSDKASLAFLKPWEMEERKTIEAVLVRHKGRREPAARELGISRSTLWRKIKLYHLEI